MSRYKLVASDMDETFLHDSCIIPEGNKAALARMRELGVLFVPCSGRAYNSIAANLDTLDPELLGETYIVSYNGGFINRYGDPKPLCTCGLSHEAADTIYRRGRSWDCASTFALTTAPTTSLTRQPLRAISWLAIRRFAIKPVRVTRIFPSSRQSPSSRCST